MGEMTEQDIYNLLANGERVTLECKKPKATCLANCGKPILPLPISMVEQPFLVCMKT